VLMCLRLQPSTPDAAVAQTELVHRSGTASLPRWLPNLPRPEQRTSSPDGSASGLTRPSANQPDARRDPCRLAQVPPDHA
jgi:hypothetical protein